MEKEQKDLSIIVPVYNVEKYLSQCLKSLVNQSIANYEVIIVNDGTKDNSMEICRSYASKYSFIRIIEQPNMGLGAARNRGIKASKGKYIAFVDSDDYVMENMFSEMLNTAVKDDVDIVFCNVDMFFEDINKHIIISNELEENKIYDRNFILEYYLRKKIHSFAWNKIYKRYLFDDIQYDTGVYYEDIYPTFRILSRINKAKAINKSLYIYRQREGNITSNISEKNIVDINNNIVRVFESYRERGNYDELLAECFLISYLNVSLDLYIKNREYKICKVYKDYKKLYYNYPRIKFKKVVFNKFINIKVKINYVLFVIRVLPLLKKIRNSTRKIIKRM